MKTRIKVISKIAVMVVLISFSMLLLNNCSDKSKPVDEKRHYGLFFTENGQLYYNSQICFNFLNLKPDCTFDPDCGEIGIYSSADHTGYINIFNNGITIPALHFDSGWQFNCETGIAAVVVDGKMGFINEKGEYLLKPQFEYDVDNYITQPFGFEDGYCVIPSATGKAGLIDTSFNLLIEPVWDWITVTGNYYEVNTGEKYGLLDSSYNLIIPPLYEYLEIIQCGIIVNNEFNDPLQKLIDFDGKTVLCEHVANGFNDIDNESSLTVSEFDTVFMRKYYRFESDAYYGIIEKQTGRVVSPAIWDAVTMFSEDIFNVSVGRYNFLLDRNGKYINL